MIKAWTDNAWEEYQYWIKTDRHLLKRINDLIKDIERNGNSGIGKPEPLKNELSGLWSRRIDASNRLVYYIEKDTIYILHCKSHYEDK